MPYPICSVVAVFKMLSPHLKHAPKPHLGYGIISFFCVLASGGMNAIVFGERWGRGQKVVAYSDVIFTMLNLFSSFTGDNMMPQAITLHGKFIIILSQYIIFSRRDILPSK